MTPFKKMALAALFTIVMLWLQGWVLELLKGSWMVLPALGTMVIIVVGGIAFILTRKEKP